MRTLVLLSHTPNPRAMKRIRLLNENDVDVFVICAKRKKNLNFMYTLPHGIKHKQILYNDINFFVRLFSLIKLMIVAIYNIKIFKPNIIHLTNLDMLLCASIYKRLYDKQVKIIYEVADIPEMIITQKETYMTRMIKWVEKNLCQNIYKLIVTSPRYYDAYYCEVIEKDKMFFMPNAPSQKVFERYIHKAHVGNTVFGFIGFIRYLGVLKKLADAIARLPNVELLIVGDGIDVVPLKEYVSKIGATNITFMGEYDYDQDISSLYGRIDVVYSAYDNESNNSKVALPNRLYEAIVCELPIIVSEGTYLSELVSKLGIGLTVDPFNVEDIAMKINQISQHEQYQKMRTNCKNIKNEYYLEQYNMELIKLYQIGG